MTSYQSAIARIKNAKTLSALDTVEKGLTRVYNAGLFTPSEYGRLCVKIMERHAEMEDET